MKVRTSGKSSLIGYKSKSNHNTDLKYLLALDIGNSRIKFRFKGKIQSFLTEKKWEKEFAYFLIENKGLIECACICSVNEVIAKKVIDLLKENGITYFRCSDLLEKQKVVNFKKVKGMGEDRKVGMIGAMKYAKPPIITIDMGTAVTINVLGIGGDCFGGVILPGAYTQMKSLANETSGLEEVELKVTKKVLGLSTDRAISNGIIYGLEGAIVNIVNKIRKEHKELAGATVILTGGGSRILMKILVKSGFKFLFKDDLVLTGIEKLFTKLKREDLLSYD